MCPPVPTHKPQSLALRAILGSVRSELTWPLKNKLEQSAVQSAERRAASGTGHTARESPNDPSLHGEPSAGHVWERGVQHGTHPHGATHTAQDAEPQSCVNNKVHISPLLLPLPFPASLLSPWHPSLGSSSLFCFSLLQTEERKQP